MSVRIDEGADLRAEGVILGAVVELHVVSTLHADEKQEGESPPRSFRNRVRPADRVRGCHARTPRGAWPCARSEERRVGQEFVRTWSSRLSPYPLKNNIQKTR